MEGTTHTPLVPLRRAMLNALAAREWTYRRLAQETAAKGVRNGRGLSHGFLNGLARGDERATLDVIEAVCVALELDPHSIAEYQLAITRRLFDERPPPFGVGLDAAIANLERLNMARAAEEFASALESAADPEALASGQREAPAREEPGRGKRRSGSGGHPR